MARISKKKALEQNSYQDNVHRTAIYTRLSVLNNNKADNEDSIENQVDIINDFLKDKDEFKVVNQFSDNGYKGTSFERPAFQKMLNDIYNNKIDCVIVKDLSRLGREYIQTCMYIQEVFPLYNVRFIAINNNIDTDTLDSFGNIILNFTNFSNNVYALDISKKISQAVKTRQKKGSFTGRNAPYGYDVFKDEENKMIRLVIDDDVADYVRTIFKLKLDGKSYSQIRSYLQDNNIPSPYEYLYQKGKFQKEKEENKTYHWSNSSIKKLLSNEAYIGNMVQGKNRASLAEDMKKTKQLEETWIRVERTHEPIISEDIFYKVQDILTNSNLEYHSKQKNMHMPKEEDIFKGKLKCDCGGNLFYRRKVREYEGKKKTSEYIGYMYQCPTTNPPKGQTKCKFYVIYSMHIKNVVLLSIQEQIKNLVDFDELMSKKKYTNEFQISIDKNKKLIEKSTKELEKVVRIKQGLYDDYSDKLLTKDEYIYACTKYKDKEISLKSSLTTLEEERKNLESKKEKIVNTLKVYYHLKIRII